MNVPPGLTERETVNIIYAVARKVAPGFRFGYHLKEDMIQYAVQKALEVLAEGKFKPKGTSPDEIGKQLHVFLRVHLRRRLANYIRDFSCRYTNPDSDINKSKFHIMNPLKIFSDDFFFAEPASDESEDTSIETSEALDGIAAKLSDCFLEDFNSLREGIKISHARRVKLLKHIKEITSEAHETS